jgi:hypothetical protein
MPKPSAVQSNGEPHRCKNCGASLSNQYCSVCGQRAVVRIVSVWEVFRDLIDEVFFLESRVWKTLGPLFFRPGQLTMDYLAGRRARYVPPVRLYIVLSVMFFILVSVTDKVQIGIEDNNSTQQVSENHESLPEPGSSEPAHDNATEWDIVDSEDDEFPDSCTIGDVWTDSVPFGTEIREHFVTACNKILADRGQSFKSALADDIPLMMIVFIPLLALSMKFLYPFSRRYYVEHLLFFVHYHAFGFLLLTLLALSDELAEAIPSLETADTLLFSAGVIYLFIYLFRAMRRVYDQSIFLTSVKYVFLSFAYFFFLVLSFAGTAVYTALSL